MFVEHKEALEAPVVEEKITKLSELIRLGKPLVGDERMDYRLCALGCAWAGLTGHRMTNFEYIDLLRDANEKGGLLCDSIASTLGYSRDICREVSHRHSIGIPALHIADWLESQGY